MRPQSTPAPPAASSPAAPSAGSHARPAESAAHFCATARLCLADTDRTLNHSRDYLQRHRDEETRQTRSFADSDDCLRRSASGLKRSYRALRAAATSLNNSKTAIRRAPALIALAHDWAAVCALTPRPATP